MPKMEFDIIDYMGPVIVALLFAIILFLISFSIINWYCITRKDDLTIFEKFGARFNMKLGPHSWIQIKRGGFCSTYAREEDEEIRRKSTQAHLGSKKGEEYMLIKADEIQNSQIISLKAVN